MIKVSLLVLLGISGFVGGMAMGVWGLQQAGNDQIPWLIPISFVFFGAGGYSFFRASRHGEKKEEGEITPGAGAGENVLLKNNEILADYTKSAEKRDKMKMLKMVSAAEEQMKQEQKTGA
ncbi:MAG: hypothetical protein ACM3IJ_02610 [Candidatus Levyibacteriota bacterium]